MDAPQDEGGWKSTFAKRKMNRFHVRAETIHLSRKRRRPT
jgi:hypothetical protein